MIGVKFLYAPSSGGPALKDEAGHTVQGWGPPGRGQKLSSDPQPLGLYLQPTDLPWRRNGCLPGGPSMDWEGPMTRSGGGRSWDRHTGAVSSQPSQGPSRRGQQGFSWALPHGTTDRARALSDGWYTPSQGRGHQ